LQDQGQNWQDAKHNAKVHAEIEFQPFVADLYKSLHRPKDHVFLRSETCPCAILLYLTKKQDMHLKESTCGNLIEKTAGILTDDTLLQLFVSIQQTDLNLTIKSAVKW
jgi:hypothetical protein